MSEITGLLPVIPTPFLDGAFDHHSMERFLDHFLPRLDGYTLLGSTGEAPSMTTDQRMEIAEFCLQATPPDKTVVVGVSHTSVQDCVALAQHAESVGAKGVLCAAPYYFQNSDPGMLTFLSSIDEAVDIELVFYDNPGPTNTVLDAGAVVGWAARLGHLHTVKLTDHDLDKIATWHAAGLKVIAGDDPIAFQYLAAGCDGAMIIVPCIFPEAFATVWRLVCAGKLEDAYQVFAARILPYTHLFGIGDEIATSKATLQAMGIFASAEVLPPLVPATAERRQLVELGRKTATEPAAGGHAHTDTDPG